MSNLKYLILLISLPFISFGQEEKTKFSPIPSIGLHGGMNSYIGEVGDKTSGLFTSMQPGYGFYLEKKFHPIFGAQLNGLFGKVSENELNEKVFRNFESKFMHLDLSVIFDFDNDIIINQKSLFAPYFSFGFGYLSFDPKGDLENSNGKYYHWDDGLLYNMPQSDSLAANATVMTRDFNYETPLKDSTTNYAKNTFTLPLRLGLKFELSDQLYLRISSAYIITFTDYIDNVAQGGGNDKIIYNSFSIQYNFRVPSTEDEKYKDFDFGDLDKMDTDKDGVVDSKDLCQNTPPNVEVDAKGCPKDDDGDGVPNYLDKEANTAKGAKVNAEGVTITDEMLAEQMSQDSNMVVQKRTFKAEDLSKDEIQLIMKEYQEQNINTTVNIPEKFKALDIDKDGYINAKEVTNAIDGFFEGENNLTAKDLNELIDFYFEQ